MRRSTWAVQIYPTVLKVLAIVKLIIGVGFAVLLGLGWAQFAVVYEALQTRWPTIRPTVRNDLNPPLELPDLPGWPIWVILVVIILVIFVSALSNWAMAQWIELSLQSIRETPNDKVSGVHTVDLLPEQPTVAT